MTNAQLVIPHRTSKPDTAEEYALTAAQIMQLKSRRHAWCCPGCDYRIPIRLETLTAAPFFIVRHLLGYHDIRPDKIIQAEPSLTGEVRDYCRQMGIRG